MNAEKVRSTVLLTAAVLAPFATAFAAQGDPVAGYKLLATITIPGGLTGNDISFIDSANARYYLADRGNANASPPVPPKVDVFDTANNQYLTSIPLTTGSNGIVSVPRAREIWVGLNDSTVAVISSDTNAITNIISTGGKSRADELAYDPSDRLILIANDRDSPPFVTFISQQTHSVVKRLTYDGVSAPQSTGGIEQPVWDAAVGSFYISIPATKANPKGEVDEIDPLGLTVTRSFPTTCGPAGLALLPGQRLITSCGDVIDILSGQIVMTATGVGGDEIWYNSGDQRVYFGGGTNSISVSVVDSNTYSTIASLTAGKTATAPAVSQTTHSVAVDSGNNEIFVPVTGVGVQVWRNGATLTAFPNPAPGTTGVDGSVKLIWSAPNADYIEVHVGSPDGPLVTYQGSRGSAITGPWVTDGMTFYLQDVTGGKTRTADNTLATLVVHLQKM